MFGLFETYDQSAQATVLSGKLRNFKASSEGVGAKYDFVLDAGNYHATSPTHDFGSSSRRYHQHQVQ